MSETIRHTPPPHEVAVAFGIVHKRALGLAVGLTAALLVLVITWFDIIVDPQPGPNLPLLRYYFYGYTVTPAGAFIGAFWAFVAGSVAGWFTAFCRNFALAVTIVVSRARAELPESSDILDHI
jgi:hypothetical protein